MPRALNPDAGGPSGQDPDLAPELTDDRVAGGSAPVFRLFESLKAIVTELESLARSRFEALEARFKRICELDDYARAILESALNSSLSTVVRPGCYRDPTVFIGRDLFGAILDGYQQCRRVGEADGFGDVDGASVLARLVRAGAERVKWERFAGGPAHNALWQWLGSAVADSSLLDDASAPHMGADQGSDVRGFIRRDPSVELEFLRALAYFSAGFEQLSADLFEIVNRLVEIALPTLQLSVSAADGAVYYADIDVASPPARFVHRSEGTENLRFLSTRRAHELLGGLYESIKRGDVPRELDLIPADPNQLAAGLEHLLVHWSSAPPVRRTRRHPMDGMLHAVRGFEQIEALLAGASPNDPFEWQFADVSRGGVGVLSEPGPVSAVSMGSLVAIRSLEGGSWHLGVVQRIWEQADQWVRLGLQTLSSAPYVIRVDDGRVSAMALMCDPLQHGEAVRLVVPLNVLRTGVPLRASVDGAEHELRPLEAHAPGYDFDLRVYQVL